jgi:hypothetical protein
MNLRIEPPSPDSKTAIATTVQAAEAAAGYTFNRVTLAEAVANSVRGDWDLPEFQRRFVWKPSQVATLADSLWRNYPVGSLLLWASSDPHAKGRAWIADGQQRLTALCILFGQKPRWWEHRAPSEWERVRARFDVRFDVEGVSGKSRFVIGTSALDPGRFIPVAALLEIDPKRDEGATALQELAARIRSLGHCRQMNEDAVAAQLGRVASLRDSAIIVTAVEHELREVLEIFDRLNSRGMKFRKVLLTTMRQTISAIFRSGLMSPEMRQFRELKSR